MEVQGAGQQGRSIHAAPRPLLGGTLGVCGPSSAHLQHSPWGWEEQGIHTWTSASVGLGQHTGMRDENWWVNGEIEGKRGKV